MCEEKLQYIILLCDYFNELGIYFTVMLVCLYLDGVDDLNSNICLCKNYFAFASRLNKRRLVPLALCVDELHVNEDLKSLYFSIATQHGLV